MHVDPASSNNGVTSMTSVNVSPRMHELSAGVIRHVSSTTAGRTRSILTISASREAT
jgi:hypothetical protein